MTRAEAEKILCLTLNHGETQAVRWVDAFVSLGMLKLDQPQTLRTLSTKVAARDRAIKVLEHQLGYPGGSEAALIIDVLIDSGFELRDKLSE